MPRDKRSTFVVVAPGSAAVGGGGGGLPAAHASTHQNGGTDEISLTGLSGVVADPQPPIIGAGATQAVAGNDSRMTNARTPTAHATSHQAGGSDGIKLDDLAAPDDNTDLNVSTSAHGLMPKATGSTTTFYRSDGTQATPAGGSSTPTPQRTSATGTQNNFDLSAKYTELLCSGAAPAFTGFTVAAAAPSDGDTVVVVNTGSGTVRVAHEDAGSTAANRATAASTRGQILGVGGAMTLVYDATAARWRFTMIRPGAGIPVAYNAGDFTGAVSMTWTVDSGDVTTFTYQQVGSVVTFVLAIENTSNGGTLSGAYKIALPNSFTIAKESYRAGVTKNAGTWGPAMIYAQLAVSGHIQVAKSDLSTWASATNNTSVFGAIDIEVN